MKKARRSPTVAIAGPVYAMAKARAESRGMTLIDYVNEALVLNAEKDQFLRKYAPYIEVVTVGQTIVLRDHKINKVAEIYIRNGTLYCTHDESDDCMHIHFALAMPEVTKLRGKTAR